MFQSQNCEWEDSEPKLSPQTIYRVYSGKGDKLQLQAGGRVLMG